ncbi:TPA: hypothetical protein RNS96_000248 [Stenotrophomonas maltophilia]|nr:hypothetical protein [Stenotrophomonas maltophilia]
MKKILARYIIFVGLPLFVLHFAGAAFEKLDTIEAGLAAIHARASGH